MIFDSFRSDYALINYKRVFGRYQWRMRLAKILEFKMKVDKILAGQKARSWAVHRFLATSAFFYIIQWALGRNACTIFPKLVEPPKRACTKNKGACTCLHRACTMLAPFFFTCLAHRNRHHAADNARPWEKTVGGCKRDQAPGHRPSGRAAAPMTPDHR